MKPAVWFAHGKESGPWGRKITALAAVARDRGHAVESPNYQFTHDRDERLAHLLWQQPPRGEELILVGSSMGAWVAAMAAKQLSPAGLFLMAPAFYMPGYDGEPGTGQHRTWLIHGWRDELIPVDNSLRYAREHRAQLHVLDSDHGLGSVTHLIAILFGEFLDAVAAGMAK